MGSIDKRRVHLDSEEINEVSINIRIDGKSVALKVSSDKSMSKLIFSDALEIMSRLLRDGEFIEKK